ncbi:MAG TPA: hypothetical protein VK613_10290 [Gaiellaceae bacterium]|nr:hypothetical protein [Gaiellaceae bacterium]
MQISQGWNVVTSDGVIVGTVAQVEGDKQSDIFDGLAVASRQPTQIRYVPGEVVGAIFPGEVTLKIASADIGTLEPFQAPPPRRSGFRESHRSRLGCRSGCEENARGALAGWLFGPAG